MAFHMGIVWPIEVNGGMPEFTNHRYKHQFAIQPKPVFTDFMAIEDDLSEDMEPNKEKILSTPILQTRQTLKPDDSPMSVHESFDDWHPSTTDSEPPCKNEQEEENVLGAAQENPDEEWEPQAEPFETFRHKVMALCDPLWPGQRYTLEDLAGGGYNRIIGITTTMEDFSDVPAVKISEPDTQPDVSSGKSLFRLLKKPKRWLTNFKRVLRPRPAVPKVRYAPPFVEKNTSHYILRIPHQTDLVELQHQAALFEFANRISKSWDVPTAIHLDNTSNNPLGVPFVVQNRIPGMNLDELWDNLNHQQRTSLGGELGKVFRDISKHSLPVPGIIEPALYLRRAAQRSGSLSMVMKKWSRLTMSGRRCFDRGFKNGGQLTPILCIPTSKSHPLPSKLTRVAEEIESSWSPAHRFFLSHNDFNPRNIMAWIDSDTEVRITAVVDWDLVDVAPAVVAFQPPCWVWKYNQYWDDIKDTTPTIRDPDYYVAVSDEEKQIRAEFEKQAGVKVTKYTRDSNSDLAKHLWQWSVDGVSRIGEFALAWSVVDQKEKEWSDSDSNSDV